MIWLLGIMAVEPRTKPPAWKMRAEGVSAIMWLRLRKLTDWTWTVVCSFVVVHMRRYRTGGWVDLPVEVDGYHIGRWHVSFGVVGVVV